MRNSDFQHEELIATDDHSPLLREIKAATIDAVRLVLELADGCSLTIPLSFYPTLMLATDAERAEMEVLPFSLHWDSLDCDPEAHSWQRTGRNCQLYHLPSHGRCVPHSRHYSARE